MMYKDLSDDDMAVLAHVVVDPETWVDHALATVGPGAVRAKINRHNPSYEAARKTFGDNYQTRTQREDVEEAAAQEVLKQLAQDRSDNSGHRAKDFETVLNGLLTKDDPSVKDALARLLGIT